MVDQTSDKVLIRKIREGDTSVYELLIDKHKNYAYTLALRVLNNHEDAEEIAHDAFLKAFRSIGSFKMESKFTTWFYKIVVNLAISRRRKKRLDTEEIEVGNTMHFSTFEDLGGMPREERRYYLDRAVEGISDVEKVLITLFYFDELGMEEISEITGIDKGNLKVKLFRARKKMSVILNKLLKEEVHSLL